MPVWAPLVARGGMLQRIVRGIRSGSGALVEARFGASSRSALTAGRDVTGRRYPSFESEPGVF